MKKIIVVFGFLLLILPVFGQNITGDWYGILNAGGQQISLVIHIQKTQDGYQTKLDSPDQHATGIPVTETTVKLDSLFLQINTIHATYKGEYDSKKQIIKGIFIQVGQEFPLDFSKKKVIKTRPKRPQEPKKPYPYSSENVSFHNKKDNVTLAGTLTLPKEGNNFPAVVLITGSGPQNRNEEILGHKPFLVISDYLTRHGIAVLRYDDRGVGKSTGDFSSSSMIDFANDAEAAFAYLRKRNEINKKEIGLVGHSEGGEIAPLIAARNKRVAFIVLLAGPGVPGEQLLLKQAELIGKANGISTKKCNQIEEINKKAFEIVKNTTNQDTLRLKLKHYYKQSLIDYPNVQKPKDMGDSLFIHAIVSRLMNAEFKSILLYDPVPALKKVSCPVLALDGSHDLQVSPKENLAGIKEAVTAGGNTNVTTKELPDLNHLFQKCTTGSPSEYGKIEETFSPKALQVINDWILKQTK